MKSTQTLRVQEFLGYIVEARKRVANQNGDFDFFPITGKQKDLKFQAQTQTGAYSCLRDVVLSLDSAIGGRCLSRIFSSRTEVQSLFLDCYFSFCIILKYI